MKTHTNKFSIENILRSYIFWTIGLYLIIGIIFFIIGNIFNIYDLKGFNILWFWGIAIPFYLLQFIMSPIYIFNLFSSSFKTKFVMEFISSLTSVFLIPIWFYLLFKLKSINKRVLIRLSIIFFTLLMLTLSSCSYQWNNLGF